jgi:scyllo-inositol 2-dehydrogenase (NADP+)
MGNSGPIRYAVVGLGRAGWNIHVKQLRGRSDAQIVAVVDPLEQRRNDAVAEFGCKAYDSLDEMLKQRDIDVVIVATPSVCHGPDTKKALKAGKHVVVEKPMATSVAEADSMIRAAKAAKRKLFVHQNYRFFREFTFYEDVVCSGILGRVYHLRNYSSSFKRRNDWQTLVKNGGGVLNNTCPHNIDQILTLIGSPIVQVMGDLQQIASSGDVEDHVKAFMRAKNGCTADMEVTTAQNVAMKLPKWVISGTCGTLTSDGKSATIHWFDPTQVKPLPAVDGPVMTRAYGNDDELPWQTRTCEAIGPDVGDFYGNVFDVLRNKGKMRVTPESAREVIRVIAMIRKGTAFSGKSAAKGKSKAKAAGRRRVAAKA